MKKKIIAMSMALFLGSLLYFTGTRNSKAYASGPPAGCTNSPFDGASCAYGGCHSSYALQSAKPWISSNIPGTGYVAGTTYTITAKAIYVGRSTFGFQVSPQTSGGAPLGTCSLINATTTQIVTYSSLQYVEQTSNGKTGTDSCVWSFKWKAPVRGTGSVTFYGCFNCANGDRTSAFDFIYPATLTIPENLSNSVEEVANSGTQFSVFPNPAHGQLNISYSLNEEGNVLMNMYSVDGKMVSTLMDTKEISGAHTNHVALPNGVNPGIYVLQLVVNGQSTIQRIVVE